MKKLLFLTLILTLLLAGCGPVSLSTPQQAIPTQPAEIVPAATPTLPVEQTPVSGGGYPQAAFAARAALAAELNIPEEQITVANIEPVEWSDSCLGAARADEMCAMVITPGYRVTLEVNGKTYIYHTNSEGTALRRGDAKGLPGQQQPNSAILRWQGSDCAVAEFDFERIATGECNQALTQHPWNGIPDTLSTLVTTYGSFNSQTAAGKIAFQGHGRNIASEAEQRAIAEWARLQFVAAQTGQVDTLQGLALTYHREGGIAGFCDDLMVWLDGRVSVSDCKDQAVNLRLTASDLEQLYGWFDTLARLDYEYTDPAVADAMTTSLSLPGTGQLQATDENSRQLAEFASRLVARARALSSAPANLPEAEKSLRTFFEALQGGDYALGAALYAGDTSMLSTWNPDIQNNLPGGLERACTQNGLQCLLPRSISYQGPDSRGGYQFSVEFSNPDGTLFRQGPCCGDANGQVSTSFIYGVLQNGETWMVLDLPPYVP